jgi:hypothetical protein
MKLLYSGLAFCALVGLFSSCIKFTVPTPPPPNNGSSGGNTSGNTSGNAADSISFFANGDSAYVTGISVDTTRIVGFEWPQIIVNGTCIIPAKTDTLTFELQVYNPNNTYVSVDQFMGDFNDTSAAQHASTLTLSSVVNYDAYQDSYSGAQVLYVDISANDGKTVTSTFHGSLTTFINNNGAPPVMTLTKGTMKLELP